MTEPLNPQVMVRQVEALADDIRALTGPLTEQIQAVLTSLEYASVQHVYLTGSGDSFFASSAAEMAFDRIAGLSCTSMSTLRLLEYSPSLLRRAAPQQSIVIATSASGATPRVVQAIERAKAYGALTIALTGTPDSPVTQVADRAIIIELSQKERSPGIRTYQASLLAMLLVAIQLGEIHETGRQESAAPLRQELVALADAINATNDAIKGPCLDVADMIANAPALIMLGSGPNYGTAGFCAAKVIEAAGMIALSQDLEEWWHIERFAYPIDMPVFIIAPPGLSYWRASEVAAAASKLGRRVIAVTHADDREVTQHSCNVLPVHGHVREEFSPLLYHLFTSHVAALIAEQLGRLLFQGR